MDDRRSNDNERRNPSFLEHAGRGLGVWPAVFLISGETAGVGVLSMPKALAYTGWIGLPLIVFLGLTAAYTGQLLGRSWLILQQRFPGDFLDTHCRFPYPAIGDRSLGAAGRFIISCVVNLNMFGSGVVFFVLAAENLQTFIIGVADRDLSLCWLLLVVFAVFVPVTWLGSPKDFWQLSAGAWLATTVVLVLVCIQALVDPQVQNYHVETPRFSGVFLAFGTLMYAYGVHPVLPSIQHDMTKPADFERALYIGIAIVIVMYLPMPAIGYAVYGSTVDANILRTLPSGPLQYAALFIITGHLLLAANIIWTTVYQEAEHFCNVPNRFCWQRAALRTLIMAVGLFCALSLPHFGVLLDLVGGICFTSLCYIFPPLCYYFLCVRPPAGFEPIAIPLWERTLMLELLVLGVFGAIASTYAGIQELLSTDTFVAPCYFNMGYYTSKHLG